MKVILTILFLLITSLLVAQSFEISGTLQYKDKSVIESATIYVESVNDGSMISYTISDVKGKFSLTGNTKHKKVNLLISYTGLKTYKKEIDLTNSNVNLNTIILHENTELLNEIVVIADIAPIVIKKDILQFNASSFKTGTDANVEDLLKKLPGVIVDKNGNILVNGKPVNKILVNGKEFFGNDLKIATKNLPKEIIDKIQVVDTKTRSEEFTGEEGDKENKTINIIIKKDKNKGVFGRVTSGYGTDDRYALSGMINYFNNDERLSVLGGKNNVNTSGFNSDEVKDIGGGQNNYIRRNGVWQVANPMFSSSNSGITESTTGGTHYANEWKEKIDLSADYFFQQKDVETATTLARETFLPSGVFFTNEASESNRISKSQTFNAEFEIKPDTLTRISVKPNFARDYGNNVSIKNASNNNTSGLINRSSTNMITDFDNNSANLNMSISRNFKKKGEYFRLWLRSGTNKNTSNTIFKSNVNYFDGGTTPNLAENQQKLTETKGNNLNLNLNYTRLLSKNWFYTLRFGTQFNNSKNDIKTSDFNTTTQSYTDINTLLTNKFKTNTQKHTPLVGLRYRKDKLSIRASVGYDLITLTNNDILENTSIKNNFNNLNLRTSVWNRFGKGNSFYSNISVRSNTPQIFQLQPVPDNSNPLNIVIGNPNLKATVSNNMHFNYRNNNIKKKSGYSVSAGGAIIDNAVVSKTITNVNTLQRVTTYVNVDGNNWLWSSLNYHKTYKNDKHSFLWNVGASINSSKNTGFSNELEFVTEEFSFGPTVSFTYNFNDLFEISPNYNYDFNQVKYSENLGRDTDFTSTSVGIVLETYYPKMIEFANDFNMVSNPNVAAGFIQTSYLWNASLGVKMLKDKGLLKIKVFDLLNQNVSVNRDTNQDYIVDTENLVLRQYYMLSFTYKINKFTGKKPS